MPTLRGRPFLSLLSVASLSFAAVAACGDDGWYRYYDDNEILFGISQRIDPATGKKQVSAGYEFLGLARRGGWSVSAFRDGDGEGTCYFERYDNRLGQPHVESGVATFSGGSLPAGGLQILANQGDVTLDNAGWATGDLLTFDASGFAMPPLRGGTMNAPAAELTITSITPQPSSNDANGSFDLSTTTDIDVTWTAVSEKVPTRVMVSLVTEEPAAASAGASTPDAAVDTGASAVDTGAPAPADAGADPDAAVATDAGDASSPPSDASTSTPATPNTTTPPPAAPVVNDIPSGNVRCFSAAKDGHAIIPHAWIARLFSAVDPSHPVRGHLEIATHRQLTIYARSSWTVYVVASTQHRSIAFKGSR